MSSQPATLHDDDDVDVSLDPATRRKFLILLTFCALCVIAVAIFVVAASEDPKHVVERVQDQRDAAVYLLQSVFA
ncbi:MAG: hypothetical protein AAGC46_07145 [Solirubrobacteraceae bacterium]|nr:hypothetical protein [Patulibacter sp.]